MSSKDNFQKLAEDFVRDLSYLVERDLKPSKKLRLLSGIIKESEARLAKLTRISR